MKPLHTLLALGAATVLAAQAAPPEWDKALAHARQVLGKDAGYAGIVMLERTDPQNVNIRLQVLGTLVRKARFQARATDGKGLPALFLESGKGMDSLRGSSLINEQFLEMEVSLEGEDFQPRILMRIPRSGERPQVGTVLMGTHGK